MSSPETTKKRKPADGHQGGGDCESNAATDEGGTTLASILAEMKDMKSEMNDMGRLSRMDELEKKCKSLEGKCNSLERSIQILIKEQKWEYSAPSIPTGYWVDRGLDEGSVRAMKHLLQQMEGRTTNLRSGRNIQQHIPTTNISLSGYHFPSPVLRHYDELLPHWEELANALQLYQNSSGLLSFSICNVQLTPSVIDLLAQALKGKEIFDNFDCLQTFLEIKFALSFK